MTADLSARKWTWRPAPAPMGTRIRADRRILDALAQEQGSWEPAPPASIPNRSRLQQLIDEGRVLASGAPLRPGAPIPPDAVIELILPEPRPLELIPENRPLEILFEDEHLVVLNKPQGLTVHPSETQREGTLVHALLHHVKDLSGIGGVLRPGIVHRLDKDTSGAMVVTKTDAAHRALAEIFSVHAIRREYWALCYGAPPPGRIESLIGRNPSDRKKMSAKVLNGRKAVTRLSVLELFGEKRAPFASLACARLETGRTHQVRVHLTGTGHSILGDPVYGVPSERHPKWLALPTDLRALVEQLPGQALHARVLGFDHPITGQSLIFEAPPPKPFQELLDALRKHSCT